ncbi:SOS response-associated peptidase [Agrobacterium sp. rho-8.1]|nr:SOS response-associated peptidase [Agrobacterium sp. rho-8.1]
MCGRFVLNSTPQEVAEYLDLIGLEEFPARFNIAPTQPILIVLEGAQPQPGSNLPNRQAMLVRWGFLPGWVKDPKDFPLLINARSETAIEKASFRAAMRHRRVLIPATGFYEWHRPSKEEGGKSQAYYIRPKRGGIVAFAGLMETWSSADGSEVDTGAFLTTSANRSIARIHDRMPVVIAPEDFSRWLDCKMQEPRDVVDLMKANDDDFFEIIPVSDKVNKVANVGADLLVPVTVAPIPAPKIEPRGDAQMSLF